MKLLIFKSTQKPIILSHRLWEKSIPRRKIELEEEKNVWYTIFLIVKKEGEEEKTLLIVAARFHLQCQGQYTHSN